MNNKLEVIGIDHGWSMMKTISQVFVTGVKEITTTPALFGDVLEYEGKFYKVGAVRQEVKDTKVEDDSFYLLTLAAVAKELKRRGLAEAKVFLAVGLPLTRFGAEKNDFIKYLTKNKRVSFKYENESSAAPAAFHTTQRWLADKRSADMPEYDGWCGAPEGHRSWWRPDQGSQNFLFGCLLHGAVWCAVDAGDAVGPAAYRGEAGSKLPTVPRE